MDIEAVRSYCLSFPHTTENVQWGYDLCMKVDGKLFAVMPLEVAPAALSFKCTPENFADLCERPGVKPAAYMARAQWISLEKLNTLADSEMRALLRESYRLVWERLPKGRRALLEAGRPKAARPPKVAKPARQAARKSPAKKKAGRARRRA